MTRQSATYHVHPSEYVVDLKEKISLAQGYPISELNLIFQGKALVNSTTLSNCGVSRASSELTLMLLGGSNTTIYTSMTFFTSVINPALSISHLNLGLRLDSLLMGGVPVAPPNLAHRQPLPSHLLHIVHVHDIPFDGFQMLLVYLYSKHLMEPPNCKWTLMILVIDQGIKACKIFHFLIDYTNKISNVTFLHCAVLLKILCPLV